MQKLLIWNHEIFVCQILALHIILASHTVHANVTYNFDRKDG